MNDLCWILGGIAGILELILSFKIFFRDTDDLKECIGYLFTPNLISLLHGEYWEDFIKSLKFQFYLLFGVLTAFLVYRGFSDLFQAMARLN